MSAARTGAAPQTPVRPRLDWIDVVRGSAVLLVIVVHVMQRTELFTGHEFTRLGTATVVVTPLRLPTMFLLSGLFVPRSLAKGAVAYVAGKLRRIAWPYLLWSVILIALFDIGLRLTGFGFGWEVFWRIFYDPIEHLWFLAYLFLYFLIALLVRWIPAPYLLAAVIALSAVPVGDQWVRFCANAAFFFTGVVLAAHREALERAIARTGLAAALLLVAVGLSVGHATRVLVLPEAPWNLPVVIMFVVGLAGVVRPVSATRALAPLRYVGVHSIVFYIAHWPVASFSTQLLTMLGLGPWAVLGAGLVVSVAVPWALAWAATRSRIVDAAFVWPRRRVTPRP